MATSTTKLALRKPETVDDIDVTTDLGDNFDKIDAAIGAEDVTSTTRPSSPYTNQIIHETDTDRYVVWTGSKWRAFAVAIGSVPDRQFILKPSNEARTSTTTLSDDSDFIFSVEANKTYSFEFVLACSGATAGDIKIRVAAPASSKINTFVRGPVSGLTTTGDNAQQIAHVDETALSSELGLGTLPSDSVTILYKGTVEVAGTAGNFKLQWAQLASSGSNTVINKGSYGIVIKEA